MQHDSCALPYDYEFGSMISAWHEKNHSAADLGFIADTTCCSDSLDVHDNITVVVHQLAILHQLSQ